MEQIMTYSYDVAVIGGGAAGLAAAVTAARRGAKVLIAEKEARVGKKLLATGNGRCNFTNIDITGANYHGEDVSFQSYANGVHSSADNIAFFRSIGIPAVTGENGKVFPYSLQASAVLDMFRAETERLGVAVLTDTRILGVKKKADRFLLRTEKQSLEADRVIVACGGKASPELGGCDFGYALLESFGHRLTETAPALVKIKTDNRIPNALKGIKTEGVLTLRRGGKTVGSEEGEILFTDFGISGPPVLQLSRLLCFHNPEEFTAEIDFLPAFEQKDLFDMLCERRELLSSLNLEYFLTGLIQKKTGQLLLKEALNCKLSRMISSLSDGDLQTVVSVLKGFSLEVRGVLGYKQAQVTAGGISVENFNPRTMESRLVPGLYAAGEVLDIDGDCGGYNLQWAWASGRLAGASAAESAGFVND